MVACRSVWRRSARPTAHRHHVPVGLLAPATAAAPRLARPQRPPPLTARWRGVVFRCPHDGRHTAATLVLPEKRASAGGHGAARHSQMRTTMDIYSHVMPALAREAADWMGV